MNATIETRAAGPLPLAKMRPLAEKVRETVAKYCTAVEIAGSIRRERPMCGDIDLVCLPKRNADMFLLARELAGRDGYIVTNGQAAKRVILRSSGVQCDLWIAHHGREADLLGTGALPPNFAALLLSYTGSLQHNLRLVAMAKERGWQWRPQTGLVIPSLFPDTDRPEIVCATEGAIYGRLGLAWMPPPDRDAWGCAGAQMTRPEGQSPNE